MSKYVSGKLGWKGEPGDSAYEIAVKHGYTGTEAEWADEFINAENFYNKSECDSKYKLISDFALAITGNKPITASNGLTLELNYPTGFNSGNCIPIAIGTTDDPEKGYTFGNYVGPLSSFEGQSFSYSVTLNDSKIHFTLYNNNSSDKTAYYKIYLMKIS